MRGWRIGCRGKTPAEDGALLVPDCLLPQVPTGHAGTGPGRGDYRAPGYHKRDPAGRGGSNSRNGSTPQTVLTDIGPLHLAVSLDRNGTFDPEIVRKSQTRLEGCNEKITALHTRRMTTRDIRAHLPEM